jgi:putative aldouronate transport system substrate-binding protein
MDVGMEQFNMLTKSGLIWDITDVYNQYTSDIMRDAMDSAPEQVSVAKAGGRLMAIPQLGNITSTYIGWVRSDWLQRLNLQVPKTLADFKAVAQAFATRDPDGNGKADTSGFLINWGTGWNAYQNGLFAVYHAYINGWIKDSSGNLVHGIIQPEVKTALADIAALYKQGLIPIDWTQSDYVTFTEAVISGRAGLFLGDFADPVRMPKFKVMNPDADLIPFPIPSIDSKPVTILVPNPIEGFYVANKKFQNPEALIKLANYTYEFYYGTSGILAKRPYLQTSLQKDILNWGHNVINNVWRPEKNLAAHLKITEAFSTGNVSQLNDEEKGYYDYTKRFRDGEVGDGYPWAYARVFGPEQSTYAIINDYMNNGTLFLDGFYGTPTPTMLTRQSGLDTMRDEIFTKIIIGELPVSAFDTFVTDWKRQGGDDITKEVNAWYKENK